MITSYSQVKTANECIRKWAFGSYGGRFEPQRAPQRDGDDLHAHVEAYVKYGIPFDETKPMARLAALAKDYFPSIADDPCVEKDDLVTYGNHQYKVKPDLMWLAPCGPVVLDHKTVKHFRFNLSGTKLRMNMQAALYAFFAMKFYGTEACTVQWIYYKRPPEAGTEVRAQQDELEIEVAECEITFDDASRVLRAQQKLVDYMAVLKNTKEPVLTLPPTKSACLMYGQKNPCYNLGICFPDEVQVHGSV